MNEQLLEEYENSSAFIIATIRDREALHPAKIAGGDWVEILNFQKTIARLMVQSVCHPGMSEILKELLSFKGNEIYVEAYPQAAGLSLQEINLRLPRATAIGLVRGGKPLLNCQMDTVFMPDDQLIRIDLDDDPLQFEDHEFVGNLDPAHLNFFPGSSGDKYDLLKLFKPVRVVRFRDHLDLSAHAVNVDNCSDR